MNEARRKVRGLAFTVAILYVLLLVAGFDDLLSRSFLAIVLVVAVGFFLRAVGKKEE